MASKFEKTQGTQIFVSDGPVTEANPATAKWFPTSCSIKEISYTSGQKTDIETTTLCSEEQEMEDGLPAAAEISLTRNFSAYDDGQKSLSQAYEDGSLRAVKVIFPSGAGFAFLSSVRQDNWSAATNGIVSGTYSLRVKGKPVKIMPGAK